MIGMTVKIGGASFVVDAEVGHPDGKLLFRANDRWFLADEVN